MTLAAVTIVIATTCEAKRASSLHRAIGSLQEQRGPVPDILIVANGSRVDRDVAASVAGLPQVTVEYQQQGSLPNALRYGVSRVKTRYFGFLDDDDEYLPDALSLRCAALDADPAVDVVVTNGYGCTSGVDEVRLSGLAKAARDPLRALVTENWLTSCGGLFRIERVSAAYFDGVTRHSEWTLLGYKLALTRRVAFIDVPTYRIHLDSPGSLSKSREYREGQAEALRQIAAMDLPSDVKRAVRVKLGRAYHGLATFFLAEGQRALASRYHVQSLRSPGGLAYLPFSRKLLPFWPRGRSTQS